MTGLELIRDLAVVMVIAGAVGWACQRIGLSLIVGYLLAGAIIGPHTPPVQLVGDLDRVQVLAQLGLVFLIFSIGMDLSMQRLKRLGASIALATGVGALLVFYSCRLAGLGLGWSSTQSLFVAGMLMVSSSAIISKVLQELNGTHTKAGQMALGVTVLEDVVAVVMLTLLSTVVQIGGEESSGIATTLGTLGAFIATLLIAALMVVPRLLLGLKKSSVEVRTLVVLGMVLSLAWLAARAGYSPALGAFLLGVVVASTPQKAEIERVLQGLRDMFGAVFFVAMGMLVDFKLIAEAWPLVVGMTLFALLVRPVCTAVGLAFAGTATRDAVRAGLSLSPLGEFSFVIAQLGVAAGALPPAFYPMAVGASLLTTLAAPFVMRRSDKISDWTDAKLPLFLREWIQFYDSWLQRLARRQQRSVLWKLTARRFGQTGIQILFVSALILFVTPAYQRLQGLLGENWLFPKGLPILFWSIYGLLLLGPLVAIWRNFEALAMILAESATSGTSRSRALRPLVQAVLKGVGSALLVVWLLALLPFGASLVWISVAILTVLGLLAAVFWRRLVRWHSRLEIELQSQFRMALGGETAPGFQTALAQRRDDWGLRADEFEIPDDAACAGKNIGELALRKRFGCSIASIDRHGYMLSNPPADLVLYPRDKLLLIGTAEQIEAATGELSAARPDAAGQDIDELSVELASVPPGSHADGRSLKELDPVRHVGVQVAGVERGGVRTLTPGAADRIHAGDDLLVLGTPKQIQDFRDWLGQPANGEQQGFQGAASLGSGGAG